MANGSRVTFDILAKDRASKTFLKVATASRLTKATFDDLSASSGGLAKIIGGSALAPALAVTIAQTAALSTNLLAAGGAAGVFGLAVGGQIVEMKKQREAINKTQDKLAGLNKGTDKYNETLAKLKNQQKNFRSDFGRASNGFDRMSEAWQRFLAGTRSVSTGVIAKVLNLVAAVLPMLIPVANAAGRAFGTLVNQLTRWVKSTAFAEVLMFFQTSGVEAIKTWGHIVANVFQGVGGILSNFVGPGDRASKALEGLTARFAAWGRSKGTSKSVQKFLDFANANGDKVAGIFASMADILPKLASSLGQLGSANLSGIGMFLNLIAGMNQTTFDVVVYGLFGIAAAAKAVSIYTSLSALFVGLATALGFYTPAVAGATAGTWALNTSLLANPIALVVIAIAGLVTALVVAYQKSETFRRIVDGAFRAVKAAASAAFGWIRRNWPLLLAIITGPIGLAVLAVAKNWDKIKAGARSTVSWVKDKFGGLVDWFEGMPGKLGGIFTGLWDGVAGSLKDALNSVLRLPLKIPKVNTHIPGVGTVGGQTLIPALARGARNFRGGMALVGEEGPELVNLPRGSDVIPHSRSRRMIESPRAAAQSGGDTYINVTVVAGPGSDPITIGRQLDTILAKYKRHNGGKLETFA